MLSVWVCLALAACTSVEDVRVRQLLHEKGFGTRAQGDATAENYVAGGDTVQFIIDTNLYRQPGLEQLYILTQPQAVSIDGTIFVPYVGPVFVLGLTEQQVTENISQMLDGLFALPIRVQARIINRGKGFFMFGEIRPEARYVPMLEADMTLIEAIAKAPITELANLGRVKLVRPDARNPLVIVVNVREMLEGGLTQRNLRIRDNDIIYIPPTFLGHIARFVRKLLAPLNSAVQALFGLSTLQASYDFLVGDGPPVFVGGFNNNNFNRGF